MNVEALPKTMSPETASAASDVPSGPAPLKVMRALMGGKLIALFAASVPLGFLQGTIEVAFGFALLYFLHGFGLVPSLNLPSWFPAHLLPPLAFLLVVGGLRALAAFLATAASNLCYEGFSLRVRHQVAHALTFPDAAGRLSVADASNVLSNLLPKASNFVFSLSQALTAFLIVAVSLLGLTRLSWQLSAVGLGTILVFGLPVVLSRRLFQGYSNAVYQNMKKFTENLLKDIRNLDYLRIIGKTDGEAARLAGISRAIMRDYRKYMVWITAHSSWPQFGAVCVIALVVVANQRHGWVPAAALIPFVYLLSRVTLNTGEVIRATGQIQFNRPFLTALLRFVEERIAAPAAARAGGRRLAGPVRALDVAELRVGRAQTLLESLTFSAQAGDFVAFSGPSGKGKTTLLMTLIGLVRPLGGEVRWNGVPLNELDLLAFRERVSYAGPDPFLLDVSVRENVLWGNEKFGHADAQIWDALAAAGAGFVKDLPGGLDYRLQEGGEGISAGQKQRLSLARALLRRPDILLLDEATANVDVPLEESILSAVRARLPEAIILAVSHRPSIAKFAGQKLAF